MGPAVPPSQAQIKAGRESRPTTTCGTLPAVADDPQIAEAYARLAALKENLPAEAEEKYVTEFHSILDQLEKAAGANLSSFRIPASELRKKIVAQAPKDEYGVENIYTDERFCDRAFLMMKNDGCLVLFQPGKLAVGFRPQPR